VSFPDPSSRKASNETISVVVEEEVESALEPRGVGDSVLRIASIALEMTGAEDQPEASQPLHPGHVLASDNITAAMGTATVSAASATDKTVISMGKESAASVATSVAVNTIFPPAIAMTTPPSGNSVSSQNKYQVPAPSPAYMSQVRPMDTPELAAAALEATPQSDAVSDSSAALTAKTMMLADSFNDEEMV